MEEPPALERFLRREQMITAAGLAVLCVLTWIYLISGAGLGASAAFALFPHKAASAGMAMPGAGMAAMAGMDGMTSSPAAWTLGQWALTIAMWQTMMVAMMTPAAAPTILLYARVRRGAAAKGEAAGLAPTGVFAFTYLLVWLGFSVAAAAASWGLEKTGLVSAAAMGSASKWLSAALLTGAGLYQLSPLKRACLNQCRQPALFISRHWRPGTLGAVRLGALHGAYCVGCCGVLMALLFVGGVMNLVWIAVLTLLVLAEKLAPKGAWIGQASGVMFCIWGVATLFA